MGGVKQLAEWPASGESKALVAAAFDAIRPICDEIVVVLGHEADRVIRALGNRHFQRAKSDPDEPMFESIRAGLRAALAIDNNATVVLQPGDHPEVAASTLSTLTDWSTKNPSQAIIPQVGDRGGHPALIPAQVASLLIMADCPNGLGEFWSAHPDLCLRVPVNDLSAVQDIDTPGDLR
jgi:CTP:molybdopterin cytidylyltransferase MocA